ncbi:oxygen-insensitive NADPH nitroreductase [Neisseria montereyensis]|uniref:Oxygen-insensitive NADPH nitroreductase n=1 Tax=Neisseria montereyensis TaxID=2973938 RepID=A0ABT2FA95_9NEIS|nr:oxygen-insensitive NADPH nitroreductase [Neisseria montereyensis]MCS4533136.1 oxygen-insensitive NADPH nitroreductase [Neisseria montereyensis]
MSVLPSKPALETALNHRSIRKFTEEPITAEMLEAILKAGQAASTSSFMQPVHIIRVTDTEKRKQLRAVGANQHYIETSAELLVFCIDFAKHKKIAEDAQVDWTELTLMGAIDAGIMAQNVLLTAESLGLGGVYIGALRDDINSFDRVLDLPEHVVPLFGMCLGHPAQDPIMRPRWPLTCVISENGYKPLDEKVYEEYDELISDYYKRRSNLDLNYTKQVRATLCHEVRPDILPFLQRKGFAKR